MASPWQVFYSYAREDLELQEKLATHLKPLVAAKLMETWHAREIKPGSDWEIEIDQHLQKAHLILFLLSPDFLASDYCFGVEVEKAFARLKRDEIRIFPVLMRPCLWEVSPFSNLQILPRDARAISSCTSIDDALHALAREVHKVVSDPPPSTPEQQLHDVGGGAPGASVDLVRHQVRNYARLYERTRQRMTPGPERTQRMEQIFQKMRLLATAAYPLLDDLANSPSPGERLAAVAILQVFAAEKFLPFLVQVVGSERPFVGYHATLAIAFAVGALDPRAYPALLETIHAAQAALNSADAGFDTDRHTVLKAAEDELQGSMRALSIASKYD